MRRRSFLSAISCIPAFALPAPGSASVAGAVQNPHSLLALAAAKMPYDEIHDVARQIEWPGLMAISWSGKGLLRHTKLRSLIDASLGNRQLEHLPIAFGAIATDIATGERIVLRRGPAGEAVSASCSIPLMFEPVKIDGRSLVDGGLTEPVPVIAVREMGADIVIGVDVAFRPVEEAVKGFSGARHRCKKEARSSSSECAFCFQFH